MIYFTRAACKLDQDNESEAIEKIHMLIDAFLRINKIKQKHIKAIFFTQTDDLKIFNAASCLRRKQGYDRVALFTLSELVCENSPPRIIRCMIVVQKLFKFKDIKPVYMFGAETLRNDLFKKK